MDKLTLEVYKKQNTPLKEPREPETPEEIYRFLATKFHPDKDGVEDYMLALNEAWTEAQNRKPEKLLKLYQNYKKETDTYS